MVKPKKINNPRRKFIKQSILASAGMIVLPGALKSQQVSFRGKILEPAEVFGLQKISGEDHIPGATWYSGEHVGDGFQFKFPAGTLANQKYLVTDMLADGNHMIKFLIELKEGENGRTFRFRYGVLNQCSLRMRMPLDLVDQNRWGIDREGAFLKPRCAGDRVDLEKVDRIRLTILKKSEQTSVFCLTPLKVTGENVPVIEHPALPKGKLIDDIGQSTIHEWEGKTKNLQEQKNYLRERFNGSTNQFPEKFTRNGGWKEKKITNGNGYFGVTKHDNRWWLVDPEGYLFWSSGVDCVRVDADANMHLLEDALEFLPPRKGKFAEIYDDRSGQLHINYMAANFIRTFGEGWRENWATIALDELKRLRFNTVGNWSEWEFAANAGVPYVRPMSFNPSGAITIYRDFPDVFHKGFEKDAADYAQTLNESKNDPALIGYFMMNEPKWAFSSELPAVGMLYNNEASSTRSELASFLQKKYSTPEKLQNSWGLNTDFDKVEKGKWKGDFTKPALKDLEEFSEIMVEKYFGTLSSACKKVDPNHLNLGIRYAGVPPKWAVSGMKSFDVFSMNCYQQKVPFSQTEEIHKLLQMPVIIGEWHFGALDVGLPSSGIGHVPTQEDRGKAYRVYLEDAAANPYCVGVHWFTLYDQSALGRFDGENYNIGFLDICNQPHQPLCIAAIKSHEAVYEIAAGKQKPYNNEPQYLPKLF